MPKSILKIQIPKGILQEINKKGFSIYNFLTDKEVFTIIKKKFFDMFYGFFLTGALISSILIVVGMCILFLIDIFFEHNEILKHIFGIYMLIAVGIYFSIVFLVIPYGIYLGAKYSSLRKDLGKIFITQSYFLIHSKILPIKEQKIYNESPIYNKKLFTDEKLIINEKPFNLLNFIEAKIKNKKLLDVCHIFIITMFLLSFQWTLLTFILFILLGSIMIFISQTLSNIFYRMRYRKFHNITQSFESLEIASDKLFYYKLYIGKLIKNNKLHKIPKTIKNINIFIKKSEKSLKILKENITNSEIEDIFDFQTYSSWIKKQIISPLQAIKKTLEKNISAVQGQLDNIEKNTKKLEGNKLQPHLILAKKRLKMGKKSLEKQIINMENYIQKLTQ